MDLAQVGDAITVTDVIGMLIAIGGVVAGLRWLRPIGRAIRHFLDDWNGQDERPGVERRPGVMEQLSTLRTDLDEVKGIAVEARTAADDAAFHSKPNHGTSAYDDLMRAVRSSEERTRGEISDLRQSADRVHVELRADVDDLKHRLTGGTQ
ncbi:hypothetical protein GCM10009785_34710 [Brooklawnia cerclae]|uniref:Uncharacterized protein n=1 Tax=Brooklawnia cerclae TaxID=349934 RepID=A0ABX0SJ77_9ACTN|nr:hypothetical protein [Brooklawnia cerclae]NIH58460.1 hypothetical protein [Brooklawnia cerclae]